MFQILTTVEYTDGLDGILIQGLIAAKHLSRVFTNYTNTTVYITDNSKLCSYAEINYNTWQHKTKHYIFKALNISANISTVLISSKIMFPLSAVFTSKDG